jgi:hypothetical protein
MACHEKVAATCHASLPLSIRVDQTGGVAQVDAERSEA